MSELKFIGFGERAAMQQWLSFTALVAVGIKVILGQDWHINYWDLCSSVLQLLFIQGETGHSGSTGPHYRKSRPHRWDAWGCTQWTLATYRLSREVFWEGCRQKRGCRGWKEERKEGRKEEEGGAKLEEQCPQWMRSRDCAVAMHRHCQKRSLLSYELHSEKFL